MKPLVAGIAALSIVTLGLVSNAEATPITFTAELSGANESPANASPGFGFAQVDFDFVAGTMRVRVTFGGLTAGNTASHIHCCTAVPFTGTAGVATTVPTFTGFPSGTTAGDYDHTFDMTLASSYNPAFVTAQGSVANAELALYNGMLQGRDYLNIHTTNFPGGEIRGFLRTVPEPSTIALFGAGLLGIFGLGMMRRRVDA
jgi:hypothetical protein